MLLETFIEHTACTECLHDSPVAARMGKVLNEKSPNWFLLLLSSDGLIQEFMTPHETAVFYTAQTPLLYTTLKSHEVLETTHNATLQSGMDQSDDVRTCVCSCGLVRE